MATSNRTAPLRREWPLLTSIATAALFLSFGRSWLDDLSSPLWFAFIVGWLFGVILSSAFAVVRHAEGLAARLGEPLGTLVLTLSVTGIEVMIITAAMSTGHGSPTLARDAMYARRHGRVERHGGSDAVASADSVTTSRPTTFRARMPFSP